MTSNDALAAVSGLGDNNKLVDFIIQLKKAVQDSKYHREDNKDNVIAKPYAIFGQREQKNTQWSTNPVINSRNHVEIGTRFKSEENKYMELMKKIYVSSEMSDFL